MAEEITVSTPETSVDVNTSAEEFTENNVNTSETELTDENVAAETGNEPQSQNQAPADKKLFADKYESPEELEKGYKELNREFTQLKQQQSDYNKILENQKLQDAIKLEQAKQNGYNTVQEQEIANRIIAEEFNAYANGLNLLSPEYIDAVRQNLMNYYQTSNKAYLEEAKRYFPSDFIERVALGKQQLYNQLQNEYFARSQNAFNKQEQELAEIIKTDYADFLTDIKDNTGKSEALKMFCNGGFIQSKEDMQTFVDIFSRIEQKAGENAIKEYEAKKTIEEQKRKAVIDGNANTPFDLTKKPNADDIEKMSQKQFDEICDKYGTDWIYT